MARVGPQRHGGGEEYVSNFGCDHETSTDTTEQLCLDVIN